MQAYRLFFFDLAEHIRQWAVIECDDDDQAIRLAAEKADGRPMELWLRDRLVHQFAADPTRLPPPPQAPAATTRFKPAG